MQIDTEKAGFLLRQGYSGQVGDPALNWDVSASLPRILEFRIIAADEHTVGAREFLTMLFAWHDLGRGAAVVKLQGAPATVGKVVRRFVRKHAVENHQTAGR